MRDGHILRLYACEVIQMKRRVLSANYANDWIVRIIGVVMTICGAATLFIADSTSAMPDFAAHVVPPWKKAGL